MEFFAALNRSPKEHDVAIAPCYGEAHTARRRVVFFLTRAPGADADSGQRHVPPRRASRPDGPARARGCTTGSLEELITVTETQTQVTWLTQDAHDRLKAELDELVASVP